MHHKTLSWFLLTIALGEAAANSFTSVAVTYTTVVLKMTALESGLLFVLVLFSAVPGAWLSERFVTSRIGSIRSFKLSLICWTIVTCIAPMFMSKPSQKNTSYIFGVMWGGLFGWYYPAQITVFVSLIPCKQNGEMMGLFIFIGQVLSWLPGKKPARSRTRQRAENELGISYEARAE